MENEDKITPNYEKEILKSDKNIDKVLYRIWQFKYLSRNCIYKICFDIDKKQINEILERLVKQDLVKIIKNDFVLNIYQPTLKGCQKLKRYHSKADINLKIMHHQETLYKLIEKNKWNEFLSPREIVSVITWKKYQKINPRMPDLLVIEKVNENYYYKAIEVEITAKSKFRYYKILSEYHNQLIVLFFNEVIWYCLPNVAKVISSELNDIYLNSFNQENNQEKLISVKLL